ncbi:MAG: hypothetical protein SFU86_19965 [Pirellulaceae bacterium]|nr:hypothetical protein [Pirellulaceae bacterium]
MGTFIVWQLIFIPLANLLDFYPHRALRMDELTDLREVPPESVQVPVAVHALSAVTDRWAQLTGQQQMWWLFAPQFPPQATFAAVELRWPDREPVLLRSSLEPADTSSYFRPPGSGDRLFQYEMHLGLGLVFWNPATAEPEAVIWRKHFADLVRMQWKSMRAYLRWKTKRYLAANPNLLPPSEAILLMRIYRTPQPGEPLDEPRQPFSQAVARWRLADDLAAGQVPVEAVDPFSGEFVRILMDNPSRSEADHD